MTADWHLRKMGLLPAPKGRVGVLHIGCGRGELLLRAAEQASITGMGVDADEIAIGDAQDARDFAKVPVYFMCADPLEWLRKLPPKQWDWIVLEHPSGGDIMGEVIRLLKPGGVWYCCAEVSK